MIEDQINALRGKRYFSLLDLMDGFHYISMAKDSIKYTAFVIPFGQYLKMTFGLKNARFQRYVNDVLSDLIKIRNVVNMDFLIATETLKKHFEVLDQIFCLLTQNCFELRLDKCRFIYEEIEFLSYVVSKEGIRRVINTVKNFPKNVHHAKLSRIKFVF